MSQTAAAPARTRAARPSPRLILAAVVLLAATAGYLATPAAVAADAVQQAGTDLTRLLRMMAAIKLVIVAGAFWLVDWRFRFPIPNALACAYLAGLAAMAAGPGLIWSMAHVACGAALLHGGVAIILLLVWRDPGNPAMARMRGRA